VEAQEVLSPFLVFEEFTVDPVGRLLFKAGQPVRIQEQPFQMLLVLLEKPGGIVSREEFRRRLWAEGTFVDFDNSLNAAMNKLREALDDSADAPRFVETLPRRGYRFISDVRLVEDLSAPALVAAGPEPAPSESDAPLSASEPPREPAHSMRIGWQRFWLGALSGVSGVIFLLVGFLGWQSLRQPAAASSAASARIAVAVLPFKNLSGDPAQDVFAGGLSEEMITQLGRVQPGRLNVASSSAVAPFRNSVRPLPEVGRELDVAYVLEGGIRREGNRLRITAQLVHVEDQLQVMAQTYEANAGNLLEVQKDVATRIARALEYELLSRPGAEASPSDKPAVHAYLHGRFLWNKRTSVAVRKALEYFQQSAAADPNYAPAYAGIADCYAVWGGRLSDTPPAEAYRRAREAAAKALQLDPTLAEAHATLAVIRLEHEWDFAGADAAFRRAIELKPDYAVARQWYAEYLATMGRHQEALAEIRRALQLDPFSLSINLVYGQILMYSRDYDAAIAQFNNLIELHPDFVEPYALLNRIYLQQGRSDDFAKYFLQWGTRFGFSEKELEGYRRAYQSGGTTGLLRERRRVLVQQQNTYFRAPYIVARIHAVLGEHDQALQWLEKAMLQRDDFITHINVDPEFDSLRSDPRFQRMLQRIGLTAPPRASALRWLPFAL
jgi:TolB-like protein/DNA-binding winged helix-turn-helix (wHTH) protein/Tfp pilus assembly protein PilF